MKAWNVLLKAVAWNSPPNKPIPLLKEVILMLHKDIAKQAATIKNKLLLNSMDKSRLKLTAVDKSR